MLTVNIHEAKTHLSRLLERAAKGEPFIIAKAGKPLARWSRSKPPRRVRFAGSASWPGKSRCPMARLLRRGLTTAMTVDHPASGSR